MMVAHYNQVTFDKKYTTRSSRAAEIKDRSDSSVRTDFRTGVMPFLLGGDIEPFVTRASSGVPNETQSVLHQLLEHLDMF